MIALEELVARFEGLPFAVGNRWAIDTVVHRRMHLSRGEGGAFAVVLEGDLPSFGPLPQWAGVSHSDAVIALPSGVGISALRISSPDQLNGNRVVAHIAYELARQIDVSPMATNEQLVAGIDWMLPLLGSQEIVLTPERQYGLLGECILLYRLLGLGARIGVPGAEVLARWKGATGAKRDFAAKGIAVEVKATSHLTRLHYFGSLEQLEPQMDEEEVFLFSVGFRRDASAPKKLPDYFTDIEAALVDASGFADAGAVRSFRDGLTAYGYDTEYEGFYRGQHGFSPPHLPPALFRQEELERVRLTSFKGDTLPGMVVNVGYSLEIGSEGLTGPEMDAILQLLLTSPAL